MKVLPVILLAVSIVGYGQSTLRPNIYYHDLNYYNVAASSLNDSSHQSYSIYTRYKFVENEAYIWNKPATFFLNHVAKIKNKPAFYHIAFINDRYSFYSRNAVYTGYSREWKFGNNNNSVLSAGGRLVLNFDIIDWDEFKLPSHESGKALKLNADLDLGITYRYKKFALGLATKNLIGSSLKLEGEKLLINQREYYLNASYLFRVKRNYEISPYLLLRQERNTELDLGLNVGFFRRVNVSYQLRLLKIRHIFILQGYITRSLSAGVSFDYSGLLPDHDLDTFIRYVF